jgi:hypothetical protein
MNNTPLQSSPITLDRRLVVGETDYQVTAFPTDDHRIDLCIVSSDGDGHVVSEISGGLAPADLPGFTEILTSTLAGLIAMTHPPSPRPTPPPEQRGRHPNQGTRWAPSDDDRLVTRFRGGARLRDLSTELGRSPGGIRARLEHLGELAPGGSWHPRPAPGPGATTTPPIPDGAAIHAAPPTTVGGDASGAATLDPPPPPPRDPDTTAP